MGQMKKQTFTNVCLVETVYTLFLYMLIIGEKEFDKTFFFCSESLPQNIRQKLSHIHCFVLPQRRWERWLFRTFLYWTSSYRFPFLNKSKIYGSDNYLFSSGIVGKRQLTLIEDGASNYSLLQTNSKLSFLKEILMGPIAATGCGGISNNVDKIYLTGLLDTPEQIRHKVELVSVEQYWESISPDYRNRILSLFEFPLNVIQEINKYDCVLFTQPMAEDGLITEKEEINLYKQLLEHCDISTLLIKVHPRDQLDYHTIFPDAYVLTNRIPMEILTLLGVRFKDVYTVFSTAALSLPYKTNIHFMGTSAHPRLLKCRGKIEYHKKTV